MLSFEALEDRRLLAHVIVNTNLQFDPLPNRTTLPEAIAQVNAVPGEESLIEFNLTFVEPGTLSDQIYISQDLPTITAPSVTIDGKNLASPLPPAQKPNVKLLHTGPNSSNNLGSGLQIDGSSTGGGTIEIRYLEISSFISDGIRVVGMGANDAIDIHDSRLHHNDGAGIRVQGVSVDSSQVNIHANRIWSNGTAGIVAAGAAGVTPINPHYITGNDIGVSASAGNFGPGVSLGVNATNYSVTSNTIAGNDGAGIRVASSAHGQNNLTGNSFLGNDGIPIDLIDPNNPSADGPTPNDENDTDSGPNNLLNYPVIDATRVSLSGANWSIPVTLDVDANAAGNYFVQFYKVNPVTKEYRLIWNETQYVPASGDLAFMATIPANPGGGVTLNPGDQISAILMDNTTGANSRRYNTSEFPATAIVLDAAAPRVVDVRLDSTLWTSAPLVYSYASIVPTGKQLASIYTQNINQLQVVFNEEMQQSLLTIANVKLFRSNGTPVTLPAGPTYSSATHTATWTLGSVLPADKYRLEISTAITDLAGKALDGEWMNLTGGTPDKFSDDPTGRTFTVGDGTPGSTNNRFEFWLSVFPGDYNQNGVIDAEDDDPGVYKDGNGDGLIDAADAQIATDILNTPTPYDNGLTASRNHGDYNDNETVTLADYMVWKTTYGNILANEPDGYLEADGNGNGVVDAADYNDWYDHLSAQSAWYTGGTGSGGGLGGTPVFDPNNVPRVANVTISSSLQTEAWQLPYSFDEHDGSGEQLRTVPVGGADTISITFTEDVNISADCLRLEGMRTANRPTLVEFSYDLGTMTATWRFTGWALGDQYLISLSDAVTDIEGNALDGEWTNPASVFTTNSAVSEFPSGDGYSGGDFNFVATLLPGDANLDLIVDSADFAIWSALIGADGIFQDGDFDGDGLITGDDGSLWYQYSGYNLQNLELLADLDGDWNIDDADATILFDNYLLNLSNPTKAQGDLNGDTVIDIHDLDLMFAQYGLELDVVS